MWKHNYILIIFIVLGVFLRFYNLNWGAPYYFHPDERNVASAISQLKFPEHMNPNFFAYGSLPIYTVYFIGMVQNLVCTDCTSVSEFLSSVKQVTFEQAIVISRMYSAIFSVLLIPLLYHLGTVIHSRKTGLLAAFFALTSVGLMQFAHFGTFEMWLTFFGVLLFYSCVQLAKAPLYSLRWLIASAICLGILVSVKISSLALLPLPVFSLMLHHPFRHRAKHGLTLFTWSSRLLLQTLFLFLVSAILFLLTNPFSFLDYRSLQASMQYESGVALGSLPVFYTQEFYEAVPVVFHFTRVYPFLLNPLITLLFIPSAIFIWYSAVRHKQKSSILLVLIYLLLFLSQALMFVKWTRYMVPTLPFIYLMVAITLVSLSTRSHALATLRNTLASILFVVCSAFALAYVMTVLVPQDTRVTAAQWAKTYLAADQPAVSEIYDINIIPFNEVFPGIVLCDLYTLETNPLPCSGQPLEETVAQSTHYILPSQRILKSRMVNPARYPQGHTFYDTLFAENKGFELVYQTPCDAFCKLLYLGDPLYTYEQTANVFDRPTVTLFSKPIIP